MANVPSLSVVREQAKPKKLGRYELEECLGAEGGRETYRARVRGLAGFDRIFAVKCLRRRPGVVVSRTDPFLTAAKRTGSVLDARVARVLDADVIDGVAIAVTEFVHGLDLDRFREWAQVSGELASGADPAAEKWQKHVAYMGAEIAAGLAAMHALAPPLVHGGLSPRNVIVTERGGIKLLDAGLGIAAHKGGDVLSQRSLAYAAPGPPGAEPTAPSDVRALGAMLFELAAGELPPPGMTSAAARRMLESHWPAMAEFIASMLAEDPALRPRAAQAAKVLASHYGGTADASMVSEMAALVRNFSAFVSDSSSANGPPSSGAEPVPADRVLPVSSGILAMAPPPPAASSGSFLAASDQATRVSPDSGYASAIFRALPTDASAPSAPEEPPARGAALPARIALGPAVGRSPTIRSFAAIKAPEMPAPKPADQRAVSPIRQAPLPVMAAGPLAKGAALPSLPPAPVIPPPRAPAIPSSPARTMLSPPAPPTPSPPAPAIPASSALSASFAPEVPVEPEPVAEVADWGAQALAALGTQAGVPISLLPPGQGEADGAMSVAEAPPLVTDPGIEEAFAFAPHPPPPAENWLGPQPGSQAAGMRPMQAPAFAPSARRELLEDELIEEEPTPLLVTTGGGAEPEEIENEPAEPPEPFEPPEGPAETAQQGRPALEAAAFIAEEDFARAPEPEPLRVAQALAALEPGPSRQPKTRNALKSRASQAADSADAVDDEPWQPAPSRAKKIAVVLFVAAGLGAGAAALTIGLTGKKGAAPPAFTQLRSPKATAATAAPQASPTEKAPVVAAAGKSPPVEEAAPVEKAAAGGKTALVDKGKIGLVDKGKTALVERAASVAPTPLAGKTPPGKAPQDSPVAASAKPATVAVLAPVDSPAKAAARTAVSPLAKAQESATSKPASEAAVAPAGPPGAAVRVAITSQPAGARAWINGEDRGETPCAVQVKPGTARVALVRAGYLTSQTTIEVRAGAKIDETLKPVEPPMTGEARFRAECQTTGKFPIVVDGKETGILCPFSKLRVDPGSHTIGLLIPATGKVHQKEIILFAGVRSVVFGD